MQLRTVYFFEKNVKKVLTKSSGIYIIAIVSAVQEWRNWQTRRLQVPVVAISCGFKSHLLHAKKELLQIAIALFPI